MRDVTLIFVFNPAGQILLCAKKKTDSGFTMALDKWNGAGGKVDPGETIEEGAIRELAEETGVVVTIEKLQKMWVIDFTFAARPDRDQRMHVFFVKDYTGSFEETDEMKPQWWDPAKLPYDQMREDDRYRLPRTLAGEYVEYIFGFDMEGRLDRMDKIR